MLTEHARPMHAHAASVKQHADLTEVPLETLWSPRTQATPAHLTAKPRTRPASTPRALNSNLAYGLSSASHGYWRQA